MHTICGMDRELILNGLNIGVLGSLFTFGAAPRPDGLGVKDYSGMKTLSLCPSTNNCVSTAEEANDVGHFIPPCALCKAQKDTKINQMEM